MCYKEGRVPANDRCYAGLSLQVYLGVGVYSLGNPFPQLVFSSSRTVAPGIAHMALAQLLLQSCKVVGEKGWSGVGVGMKGMEPRKGKKKRGEVFAIPSGCVPHHPFISLTISL